MPSILSAKIRSAHSFGFEPGDIAKLTLPEILRYYGEWNNGQIEWAQEEFTVFLCKEATMEEKREWLRQKGAVRCHPSFFRQHLWLVTIGEETLLVLEGFLTLEYRNNAQ